MLLLIFSSLLVFTVCMIFTILIIFTIRILVTLTILTSSLGGLHFLQLKGGASPTCENSPHFCIKKTILWAPPCVYHAQKLLPNNKSYRGTFPVLCWEPIAGPSVWDPLSAEATPSSHKIIRSRNKSCLEVKGRFYILEHTHILRGQMYSTQFCLIHQGILI